MSDLFLRACRGEAVERPPVWMMRQAGRYLPEYRAIRERTTFLELCKSPELAARVTLQPIERFQVDAAIVFADILLPLEAMGAELVFAPGDGPTFPHPIRHRDQIGALRAPDVNASLGYVFRTVAEVRRALQGRAPVIGFAGSPWTLAAYLVEGRSRQNFPSLLAWSWEDPEAVRDLLDRIADVTVDYLQGQVEAGAQAIQLFDTWGGLLSHQRWAELAAPSVVRILESLPAGVPRIYFSQTASQLLPALAALPLHVLSVDWRMPLHQVRQHVPASFALQGNLDPTALLSTPERIKGLVSELIADGGGGAHIVNLGHGILPQTPVENAGAFVAAVREVDAANVAPTSPRQAPPS